MIRSVRSLLAFPMLCLLPMSLNAASGKSQEAAMHTGIWRGQPITYEMRDGKALYQGDILLERVDPILRADSQSVAGSHGRGFALGIAYTKYLWPKVNGVAQIPYVIDPNSGDVSNLQTAITQFNGLFTGVIQWVTYNNQQNYVGFNFDPNDQSGQCEATEGDAGIGKQTVGGSGACTVATILHEMGHVAGLWHEQSRADRDTYVSVNYQNIIKGSRFNFDVVQDNAQNLTLYDYASIMEYPAWVQTRNGGPSIETIPAGMPLSNYSGYTPADIEGINRLYGAAPTQVTVTSNPVGLQVIVDGNPVTTPQVFSWALNSQHTLDVQATTQTQAGYIVNTNTPTTFYYTYGRWNDSVQQNHTITVTPGNGELPFPLTSPQVATYTANFVQIVPYTAAVSPTNSGTVAVSPQPQGYQGVSGVYLVARQQATLTATPANGYNFYEFNNAPYWLPGGLGANPKTFYVPDTGNPVNTTAEFSPNAVYTVDLTPETFSSNLYAYVDAGGPWLTPKNFSSFYDSGWTPGSSHTLNVDSPEQPYSYNSRYAFSSWSDGGAQSHTINSLPANSTSYVATMTPEYQPADNWQFGPPCGGASQTISPPSQDGFYPAGQVLTFDQAPATGWTFAGWTYDLTGLTSPQNLTANDETLVFANYNTTNVLLTMTGLNPPTAASGGSGLTLTISGTGFTNATQVWVNGTFRGNSIFVNGTTLQVPLTSQDLSAPVALQIFVQNFPTGWNGCSVNAALPFFVYQGAPAPIITASPTSEKFSSQAVGTTSTTKVVTLTNSGNANTSIAISVSGDFAQTNNCPATLGAGGSCKVKISFSPTSVGTIDGALTVTDSASNSPQVVDLSGTGVAPVAFSPSNLNFGTQTVGHTTAAKTVTVTNNLRSTLTFTFSASADYAIASGTTCTGSLKALGKCVIAVTFTPSVNGTIDGAVTISYSGAFSPVVAPLSGSGSGGSRAPLTFTPSKLTFTSQAVGTSSAAQTVTVKNISIGSVTLSSLSATGDFSVTGSGTNPCNSSTVLPKNGICTLSVTFTPANQGVIKSAISVADNNAVSPQVLNVTGTAVLPVTLSPATLTFAAQTMGTTSAPQTVTLANNLSATLTGLALTASGDYAVGPGGGNSCGSSVPANSQCTFTVTFTPSQTGSVLGAVTVADSASTSPQIVNLSGTGQ